MAAAAQPPGPPEQPQQPAPRFFSEQVPPHNLEAEQSVLGAMMLDEKAIVTARLALQPEDFYSEKHRIIYKAIVHLHDQHKPVDLLTLQSVLKRSVSKSGEGDTYLEAIGGLMYLTHLMNTTPITSNVAAYVQEIVKAAKLRRLEAFGRQTMVRAREAFQTGEDPDNIIAATNGALRQVVVDDNQKGLVSVSGIVDRAQMRLASMGKPNPNRLEFGLKELDRFAWIRGEVISVHAPSGNGKSTLARQMGLNIAKRTGNVAFFALETFEEQMDDLLIVQEARLSQHRVRNMDRDPLNEEEQKRYLAAAEQVEGLKTRLFFDYTSLQNWEQIRVKVLQLAMRVGDVSTIFIDYTDLVDKEGLDTERHEQELIKLHYLGKALAKEVNALMIFLDQAPIEMLRRSDPTPTVFDFEYSRGIPKACDHCLGLIIPDNCRTARFGKTTVTPAFPVPKGDPMKYNDDRFKNVILAAYTKGRFAKPGYLFPLYHHGPSGYIGNLWQRPWEAPEDKPGAEGTGSPVVERPPAVQVRHWTKDVPVDEDAPF